MRVEELAFYAVGRHEAFCRAPLHPGPCKGWKHKVRNTSTGKTRAEEEAEQRVSKKPPPPLRVKANKDIGTPSRTGKVAKRTYASEMDKDWQAHNGTLTPAQRQAATTYSGASYTDINAVLRKPPGEQIMSYEQNTLDIARTLQSAMAPAPKGVTVHRGMTAKGLGLGPNPTPEQILALDGSVLISDSFTSTTVDPYAAFSGNISLDIEVPKGTPSLWLKPNSQIPGEDELLLAAGSKMKILSIELDTSGWTGTPQYKIKARIVP